MESIQFIAVVLVAVSVAMLPCLLIWLASYRWLPAHYKLPPYKMAALCGLLSFATGAALNLELEGGLGSGVVAMLVFSLLWSVALLLGVTLIRLIARAIKSNP